jgi:enoyl-CoA hydratase/carnithine racemase
MSDFLDTALNGRVLRVALNRPEKRNALNAVLCRELAQTCEAAEADPAIGAILLTANGKAFCAGMDLSEARPGNSEELNVAHERVFTLGARLTKPLIGAVNGAALGGGAGLVANCHIVVAGKAATFGLTEIRLGLWPFLIYRAVTLAVGERRTAELALTGRIFNAQDAEAYGLVHQVTRDADGTAAQLAAAIAAFSPTAVGHGLRFVRETRGKDAVTAGAIGRQIRNEVFASEDFREGVRAFQEKRAPNWPSLKIGDRAPSI